MKVSKIFNKTLKEKPTEAEIPSHSLLIRSGMIRKISSGIYTYMPLGWKVLKKISQIIREEMNKIGCQELMMPIIQPAELWIKSGRWYIYGEELIRLKDRNKREYCLSPTHEEIITTLVKKEIKSYKELPLNLYQIQNKYRDERRPRFGLMRSREFLMKDGYSFDIDKKSLNKSYKKMFEAYYNIFKRCGLKFRVVEADSGAIGGSSSHEFMVIANSGEDEIVYCNKCNYSSNIENAKHKFINYNESKQIKNKIKKIYTPNIKSIEDASKFFNIKKENLIKTLVYKCKYENNEKFIFIVLRGNREINEIKLLNKLEALSIELASEKEIYNLIETEVGFLGAVNLKNVDLYLDEEVICIKNGITGANEKDYHFINVDVKRDFPKGIIGDFHKVNKNDKCPFCSNNLNFAKGIEVGQIFKLGNKYSNKLECSYVDKNGEKKDMIMGCYGIGVSRTMVASIEQHYDKNGIIWPIAIAPFEVVLIPTDYKNLNLINITNNIYKKCLLNKLDVIFDDREERAGIKFADSDLIGYPFSVIIGKKSIDLKIVDLKIRETNEMFEISINNIVSILKEKIENHKKNQQYNESKNE